MYRLVGFQAAAQLLFWMVSWQQGHSGRIFCGQIKKCLSVLKESLPLKIKKNKVIYVYSLVHMYLNVLLGPHFTLNDRWSSQHICNGHNKYAGIIVAKTTAFLLPLTCMHENKPDNARDKLLFLNVSWFSWSCPSGFCRGTWERVWPVMADICTRFTPFS